MEIYIKLLTLCSLLFSVISFAQDLKIGDLAPLFSVQSDDGKLFELSSRKGKWTILYFYPKAGTSGCTAQAIAFRDDVAKIKELGGDVFGISTNTVKEQAQFKKDFDLNFVLLADNDLKVTNLYGSKLPFLNYSKRWSYIIDPNLILRFIEKEVEAKEDSKHLIEKLKELQTSK